MDNKKELYVSDFIYNMSLNKKLLEVERIDDSDLLHLIMYNYNWDNGLRIPELVLDNKKCEMSTALLIFYSAGGEDLLVNKNLIAVDENDRLRFVSRLYDRIIENDFLQGDIFFEPPLTKVELYKLKKILDDSEKVFIESIGNRRIDKNLC
jgi:hypothetical protein